MALGLWHSVSGCLLDAGATDRRCAFARVQWVQCDQSTKPMGGGGAAFPCVGALRAACSRSAALACALGGAGLGGGFGPGPQPCFQTPQSTIALSPSADDCVAGGVSAGAGRNLLGLVPLHRVGRGHAHYFRRRAGPDRLLILGDLSFAGFLYPVGAGELGAVDCAAVDVA